jgi:hypothetical protein
MFNMCVHSTPRTWCFACIECRGGMENPPGEGILTSPTAPRRGNDRMRFTCKNRNGGRHWAQSPCMMRNDTHPPRTAFPEYLPKRSRWMNRCQFTLKKIGLHKSSRWMNCCHSMLKKIGLHKSSRWMNLCALGVPAVRYCTRVIIAPISKASDIFSRESTPISQEIRI